MNSATEARMASMGRGAIPAQIRVETGAWVGYSRLVV